MQRNKLIILALLAAAAPSAAFAVGDGIGTAGDLATIQASTILLKARANEEQARAELNARRGIGADADGTLPVVKSIIGNDRRLVVTFIYPGNIRVPAGIGDTIPGGYVVARINEDANTVQLQKGRERFIVGYSATAPAAQRGAGQTQVVVPAYNPASAR